jgi:hypothetical protein
MGVEQAYAEMSPHHPADEEARQRLLMQARSLAYGLERISADSRWARRSSGIRGALLKQLDRVENEPGPDGQQQTLEPLIAAGYDLLIKAAREIRGDQEYRG